MKEIGSRSQGGTTAATNKEDFLSPMLSFSAPGNAVVDETINLNHCDERRRRQLRRCLVMGGTEEQRDGVDPTSAALASNNNNDNDDDDFDDFSKTSSHWSNDVVSLPTKMTRNINLLEGGMTSTDDLMCHVFEQSLYAGYQNTKKNTTAGLMSEINYVNKKQIQQRNGTGKRRSLFLERENQSEDLWSNSDTKGINDGAHFDNLPCNQYISSNVHQTRTNEILVPTSTTTPTGTTTTTSTSSTLKTTKTRRGRKQQRARDTSISGVINASNSIVQDTNYTRAYMIKGPSTIAKQKERETPATKITTEATTYSLNARTMTTTTATTPSTTKTQVVNLVDVEEPSLSSLSLSRDNSKKRTDEEEETSPSGVLDIKSSEKKITSGSTTTTDVTSTTTGTDDSNPLYETSPRVGDTAGASGVVIYKKPSQSNDDDEDSMLSSQDEEEEEDDQSTDSDDTKTLLTRSHDRLLIQQLQEQSINLKCIIEQKDKQVDQLTAQLRREVTTKCDLVLAHTQLERQHEKEMKFKQDEVDMLRQERKMLIEQTSSQDKNMLNEMVKLTDIINDMKRRHQEAMDDWERLHRNEMLEKEYVIAQLTEELRRSKLENQ